MSSVWELILEIFCHSQEMNLSVFSMLLLWMTKKKKRYFSSARHNQGKNISLFQYQSKSTSQWELFFMKSWQVLFSVVLLLPCIGTAKSLATSFNACSSSWNSWSSVSLLFKFIPNLFDPWEILTQQWVLSPLRDHILTSTPYLPCKQLVVTSNTWSIFPWKSVFTTGRCMTLCQVSSVFRHEVFSNFNSIQKSCIHTKFAQSVLLW